MKERIGVMWPDYETNFVFSIIFDGKVIWSDNNELPMSLRLLISAAVRELKPGSTLQEQVYDWMETEKQTRGK